MSHSAAHKKQRPCYLNIETPSNPTCGKLAAAIARLPNKTVHLGVEARQKTGARQKMLVADHPKLTPSVLEDVGIEATINWRLR